MLDLGLPDVPGVSVCHEIRRWSTAPIIVLSARHLDAEKVALLDAGANDYITKPFSPTEFQARVRAQLRRAQLAERPSDASPLHVGDLAIDVRSPASVTGSTSMREAMLAARPLLRASPTSVLRWLAVVSLATAVLWWSRPILDKAHMAIALLLVVLLASARHGWRLGLSVAVLCFLTFNFFLLPPYYTFALADPLDWLVLATFLATGAVAAHLFDRAQREAANANQRAEEIDRLSTLGAETLTVARAEEAVDAIARVVQSTLGVGLCEVHIWSHEAMAARRIGVSASRDAPTLDAMDELFEFVVERSAMVTEHTDGTRSVTGGAELRTAELLSGATDARVILLPLRVRDRGVGVLRIADRNAVALDPAKARFAAVLSYYAALGVERVRLAAAEERATALRQADRLKDALLASVSHDLRTPLTTIKALAHELRAHGDTRVLAIEEEVDRLNRLVANLLDLSGLNSGGIPVNAEVTAAEDLVGAALQRVAGMQGKRMIEVSLPRGGEIPIGCFDFSQSLRILVNLLENALKYGPPGQPIDVCVRQQAEWLVLEVVDRGPGIRAEHVERVFQPFFRVQDATPDVGGTGLGLAIARRLAEAQGGTVEYAPRPGGGSIFSFRLPGASLPELSEIS